MLVSAIFPTPNIINLSLLTRYCVEGASSIHALPLEASWAAKYAGLSEKEGIDLVSTNIYTILGLEVSSPDVVVWEGNPLEFGASVALSIDGQDGAVMNCWPTSE